MVGQSKSRDLPGYMTFICIGIDFNFISFDSFLLESFIYKISGVEETYFQIIFL